MNNYFYCYSPKLKAHLIDAGERFVCVGLNEKNHRKFWLFPQSVKLSELLAQWAANKPA